jgi:hypothetical protein
MQNLPSSLSFFITVVCLIAGIKNGDYPYDIGGVDCHSLYLSKGGLIWQQDHSRPFMVMEEGRGFERRSRLHCYWEKT